MATEHPNATTNEGTLIQFPESPMPAWVPAVTVAIGMMVFLAGSFYLRHRKVLKKRQILMDYFYIIFQYGGARRKRMVAALCNTNSITLRQLGRSFMISFDSIANTENSCPFYMEESPFTNYQSTNTQRRTLFRSKSKSGGGPGSRLRPPFRSPSPNAQRNQRYQNPTGFQEIRMKFKSKKTPNASPEPCISEQSNMRLMPPKLGSLCSIHDDDPAAIISSLTNSDRATSRRNAYVYNYDSSGSVLFDEDFDKPPIPNVVLEQLQQQSSSGKRNSEPLYSEGGHDGRSQTCLKVMPDESGTKIYGTRVLYPSTDRFDIKRSDSGSVYRNNEPTIMIHSASNDFGSDFELDDLQSPCSNGLVFVKKVTKEDGTVERYYINEKPSQNFNQDHRASLSKVSYVPSGNMNEYYHNCLQSPKKGKPEAGEGSGTADPKTEDSKSKSGWPWKKPGTKKTTQIEVPTPPISRRGRLSLGDIAISNFNRRIVDFESESIGSNHDSDDEQASNRNPKDQPQGKPATTWRKLMNVFSGSRSSQSSVTKIKHMKSMQSSEDRVKRVGKRAQGRLSRFVNTLMGFRSLDTRRSKGSQMQNKNSKSLPMGLDKQITSTDALKFRRSSHAVSLDSHSAHYIYRHPEYQLTLSKSKSRPPPIDVPPKTQSFPEDMLKMQDSTDSSSCVYSNTVSPRRNLTNLKLSARKNIRNYTSCDSYTRPRSNSDVHRHFLSHQTSSQSSSEDPYFKQYHNLPSTSSPRSKGPLFEDPREFGGVSCKRRDSRYRSLNLLPEKLFRQIPRRKCRRFHSHSERSSFSERGKSVLPYLAYSADFALPLGLICNSLCSHADKTTGRVNSEEKPVTNSLQSSFINIDHIDKDSLCVHSIDFQSKVKYRHSISGPTCNGTNSNDENQEIVSTSNVKESPPSNGKQRLTLDVTKVPIGTSSDSVYYDTVSILSSPSNLVAQNTNSDTPMNKADHSVIEMPAQENEVSQSKSHVNNTFTSEPQSSSNEQTKSVNGFGNILLDYAIAQCPHNTPCSETLITIHNKSENGIASESASKTIQESTILTDIQPLIIPCISSTCRPPTLSPTSPQNPKTPSTSHYSFDSQPSTLSSTSLELKISSGSVTSTSYILQESFEDDDVSSPLICDIESPSPPSSLDKEGEIDKEEQGACLETNSRNFHLNLLSQESATFQIVTETDNKLSPEEAAIYNLTRLPRFSRRASSCSPSSLSPGSGTNTPIHTNATSVQEEKYL